MNLPLISIIIPVYNVEQFLKDCIESVIHQSYENLEIILVDDGSPDNCPKICDEYAKIDNRIIVIHQINQGVSEARNSGIKIAKGEYFSFVDSDDIIHKDYIKTLYESLNDSSCKLSMCNNISFIDSIPVCEKKSLLIKTINFLELFEMQNSMCVWGKLFHNSLFENISFPSGKIHEDDFVIYKVLYNAEKIAFVDCDLYYYRTREGSIMHNLKEKFFLDLLDALLDNYNFFYSKNESKICELFLLRLTYLNTDYNNFCKLNLITKKKSKNISSIIYKLPKKEISFKIKMKVFIKTTLIYIFRIH